ncbi:MAG: DUF721 domain-containing protein [Polyangiales bacterium]|nr:DUF721 domain-containing protein [Myxococcales bacterium]
MKRRRVRGKKKVEPAALRDVLNAAYPSKEPEDLQAVRAFYHWEKSVPPRVIPNVRPVRLSRGVLTLHAKNSVWAQEVSFLEPQVLESLSRHAPEARIRKIVVRVGALPPLPPPVRRVRRAPPVSPVRELPEEVARSLAGVHDDGLRDAIAEAARMGLARARAKRDPDRSG